LLEAASHDQWKCRIDMLLENNISLLPPDARAANVGKVEVNFEVALLGIKFRLAISS
jgi:hypothetical protein